MDKEKVQKDKTVLLHRSTVLDLIFDNYALKRQVAELQAQNTRLGARTSKFETIGRITKDIVAKNVLSTASMAVNGVTYQMDLCLSDEGLKPMVVLEDRSYILFWEDMVKLADFAGLFSEVDV